MRLFILEDSAARIQGFIDACKGKADLHIATHVEAAKEMWSPPYDGVFLDHDLSILHYQEIDKPYDNSREDTGLAFCKWLVEGNGKPSHSPLWIIHSMNYGGGKAMEFCLSLADFDVIRFPFGQELLDAITLRLTVERNLAT